MYLIDSYLMYYKKSRNIVFIRLTICVKNVRFTCTVSNLSPFILVFDETKEVLQTSTNCRKNNV